VIWGGVAGEYARHVGKNALGSFPKTLAGTARGDGLDGWALYDLRDVP